MLRKKVVFVVTVVAIVILIALSRTGILQMFFREAGIFSSSSEKAVYSVYNRLNEIRREFRVPEVKLLDQGIAQKRADDMVKNRYFGHCGLDGIYPYYYYTSYGGVYAFEENLGYVEYSGPGSRIDPVSDAVSSLEEMVYNDAESGWRHRDSILDPTNNYVDIGVSWVEGDDYAVLVLVIYMEKVWVEWIEEPSITNNTFHARGRFTVNTSIDSVYIYFQPITPRRENKYDIMFTMTCASYGLGNVEYIVVPEEKQKYYIESYVLTPIKWVDDRGYFEIEFSFDTKYRGHYIVVVYMENNLKLKHPTNQAKIKPYLPILEYTIVKTS